MGPGKYLTIDETLYPMRHHVAIKPYSKDKPAGYGVNFKSVNSVEYSYPHSVVVSAGKPPSGEGPNLVQSSL